MLAAAYGKEFTPHQIEHRDGAACSWWRDNAGIWRKQLLPDLAIWSAPGEHHEIKHKEVMRNGCYGYEAYRLRELIRFSDITGQRVYLTIHDWRKAGASCAQADVPNRIEDWLCADVTALSRSRSGEFIGPSLVGGILKADVHQYCWQRDQYFTPLAELWASPPHPSIKETGQH